MKKLLALLLIIPVISIAQIPDPLPGTYVNDSYGYLHKTDINQLNKNIRTLEDSFGIQLAVVLVPTIPEKYSIEDYAREIGRKWHVGHAKNGLVYVAAIDQHKQRLEVASHLEGVIPDIIAKGLLQKVAVYYRSQKYGEGLLSFVSDLQVRLASSKDELRKMANDQKVKKAGQDKHTIIFIIMMIAGVAFIGIIIYMYYKRRREEKEAAERIRKADLQSVLESHRTENLAAMLNQSKGRQQRQQSHGTIVNNEILPIVPLPDSGIDYSRRNDDYNSGGSQDSSSSSGSSDYGSWGSGSTDSGSSGGYDSGSSGGYDGGGATDNW